MNREIDGILILFVTDESEAVTSFVALLSTWDKQEIEQKLGQRVEFSKRAIGKLLQAYDRLLQRNGRLLQAIKDSGNDASKVSEDATLKEGVSEGDEESKGSCVAVIVMD